MRLIVPKAGTDRRYKLILPKPATASLPCRLTLQDGADSPADKPVATEKL